MQEFLYHGLPNWIMAMASVIAALTVVIAYRSYKDQRHQVHDTLSKQVRATWVTQDGTWGVMVENHTGDDIRELELAVQGKGPETADGEPRTCVLRRSGLGPGSYVWISESRFNETWSHPRLIRDDEVWETVNSSKMRICTIEYRQNGHRFHKDVDNDHFDVAVH
ncbi:hypothetical protein [Nesterenkonia sp. HG001]|uniref:hypothetical protein n=1 Tax=Nesterenkonia sp. HG001 TaxID=2983207 RepID=UPI002AC48EF3|nr:hypothetical protein [Nesterenkonia sp. HG001]MDZ5077502.1 hypothetical protein [Nesterenkonia sp. HG001]